MWLHHMMHFVFLQDWNTMNTLGVINPSESLTNFISCLFVELDLDQPSEACGCITLILQVVLYE
jgi:hypothetical protein